MALGCSGCMIHAHGLVCMHQAFILHADLFVFRRVPLPSFIFPVGD